jgi:hypothetical protein
VSGALFGDVWPSPGSGGSQDLTGTGDASKYVMGTHFRVVTACTATGLRWYVPSGVAPSNSDFAAGLVRVDSTNGISVAVTWLDWNTGVTRPSSGAQGTWVSLPLTAPVALSVGWDVYALVRTDRYGFSGKVFTSSGTVPGVDSRLSYLQNAVNFPNGGFNSNTPLSNPPNWSIPDTTEFNEAFYGVDVDLAAAGGGGSVERWGIPL